MNKWYIRRVYLANRSPCIFEGSSMGGCNQGASDLQGVGKGIQGYYDSYVFGWVFIYWLKEIHRSWLLFFLIKISGNFIKTQGLLKDLVDAFDNEEKTFFLIPVGFLIATPRYSDSQPKAWSFATLLKTPLNPYLKSGIITISYQDHRFLISVEWLHHTPPSKSQRNPNKQQNQAPYPFIF